MKPSLGSCYLSASTVVLVCLILYKCQLLQKKKCFFYGAFRAVNSHYALFCIKAPLIYSPEGLIGAFLVFFYM